MLACTGGPWMDLEHLTIECPVSVADGFGFAFKEVGSHGRF